MGKSVHLECGQKQPPNWHGHRQFGLAGASYRWNAERTARLGENKLRAEHVRQLYERHWPALAACARGFVTDAKLIDGEFC